MVLGRYRAARQYLEASLEVARALDSRSDTALDLGWLGNLHLQTGDYDEARRCLEEALHLDEEVGGGKEAIWHRVWLGAVAYEEGNLREAEEHLQAALREARRHGDERTPRDIYRWLASVYRALGDGEAALDSARRALEGMEATGKPSEQAICYALLGDVHGSGLLAESSPPEPFFERALALVAEEEHRLYGKGLVLRIYGGYLLRSGDRARGRALLREAMEIFERIGAEGERRKARALLETG